MRNTIGSFFTCISLLFLLGSCSYYNPLVDYDNVTPSTMQEAPAGPSDYPIEQVMRGKYMAELLACGTCHTDGALIGEPNAKRLYGGSAIGIAYSNPFEEKLPGVIYPANITPDKSTGIGSWTDDEITRLIRSGVDKHGRRQLSVMPWPGYAKITDEDAKAIVAYLRSLKPVQYRVPANVDPGQKAVAPFVHFGVYKSKR